MPVGELRPDSPIGRFLTLNYNKSEFLGNYDPGLQAAQHARLHQEGDTFPYPVVCHRDPGTGVTITIPWDVPYPLTVLSIFVSCGTIPATSLSFDVLKAGVTILTDGPIVLLNGAGSNQKATVEPAAGHGTARLNAALADFNDNQTLACTFLQTGAGTTTDMRMILLCRRRFSS